MTLIKNEKYLLTYDEGNLINIWETIKEEIKEPKKFLKKTKLIVEFNIKQFENFDNYIYCILENNMGIQFLYYDDISNSLQRINYYNCFNNNVIFSNCISYSYLNETYIMMLQCFKSKNSDNTQDDIIKEGLIILKKVNNQNEHYGFEDIDVNDEKNKNYFNYGDKLDEIVLC